VELVEKINKQPRKRGFPVKIVAIDGRGGAGKSTLAEKLAKELDAEIIHTDDFVGWNNLLEWWPRLIKEVIEPLQAGAKTLSYERGKWTPEHNPEPVKNQPVTPVIILEGVSSARQEFRPYLSYAIWVETPDDLCLKRGLERDGQDALELWQKWIAQENEYIKRDDPKAYADVIVSGA
jgi:uridine kinase